MADNTPKKPQGPEYPLPANKVAVLKQNYAKAAFEAGKGQYDYANTLFKVCVTLDPKNERYASEFIGNLQKKFLKSRPNATAATMATAGKRTQLQASKMSKAHYEVLKHAIEIIEKNPYDISILLEMAAAAQGLNYDEVEYVYLKKAVDANIKDGTANRRLADCLERREDYEGAIVCWERVRAAEPKDVEIGRKIHNLTVQRQIQKSKIEDAESMQDVRADEPAKGLAPKSQEQQLLKDLKADPKNVGKMMELSRLYEKEERFAECEAFLKQMVEASGGDLNVVEHLEVTQLRMKRNSLIPLRKALDADKSPANIEAYKAAAKELFLYELEYYRGRVERYPTSVDYRVEYAMRLEKGKKYKEAIEHYQKGRGDQARRGEVLLGLARCFRDFGQPKLAFNHFKEAVEAIPENGENLELHKEALYLAGLAAKAIKDKGMAKDYLSRLAGLDFSYKDVAEQLEKLDSDDDDAPGGSAGAQVLA